MLRFIIHAVDGKTEGDVALPPGTLMHFAVPAFGVRPEAILRQLSTKEGLVSVRQMGWHTGWFREESRIVGTFRAVTMEQAKRADGF